MSISSSDVWQVFNFILNPLASFLSPDAILNADTTSGRNAELAQTQQTIQLSTKLPPHFLSRYKIQIFLTLSCILSDFTQEIPLYHSQCIQPTMYRVRRGSGEHSELDPDHYTSFLCVTQ